MYEEINKYLSLRRWEINRLQRIEALLPALQSRLVEMQKKTKRAEKEMKKETRDYEKITGQSLSATLYSLLGQLAGKTEKERREAVAAQLQYRQCVQLLQDTTKQIAELQAEWPKYRNSQKEYNALYAEKERMLLAENGKAARALMRIDGQIEESEAALWEIGEAAGAAQAALAALESAESRLANAEVWGIWNMEKEDWLTNKAKHDYIDSADDAVQEAQWHLQRLGTELVDIHVPPGMQVGLTGFQKYIDLFSDASCLDWLVQGKIYAAKYSVRDVQIQVMGALRQLNELDKAERQRQADLHTRRHRVVLES